MTVLLAIPAVMTLSGCGYNRIQTLDEQANSANHDIQTQLQRRADLVPNLVSTVKGVAKQELEVFTNVANARAKLAGAVQTGDPHQMAEANDQLTTSLGRLLVITENYPQLKSDQAFLRLQDELTGTENRIATSRNDYNAAVKEYNSYIRTFPQAITAKVVGAKPREYFEGAASAQTAPTVDFSKPTAPASAPATSNP